MSDADMFWIGAMFGIVLNSVIGLVIHFIAGVFREVRNNRHA